MVIEIDDVLEFKPTWRNNLEADQPITVKHKAPTMSLYEKLVPKPRLKLMIDAQGDSQGGETEMVIDNTKIIKEMVTGISNLEIKTPTREYSIRTAAELFGDVPVDIRELVDEIGTYLQGVLARKAKDNSKN
jgi:hypothetical protein